jgi:hypothetical protein
MYVSPYGKPDDLAARLDQWAETLSKDNRYPWAGLGLIDDLKLAAATLEKKPVVEFDL